MNVPMYDHAAFFARDRDTLVPVMLRVLESGRLDWGPEVPAFEEAFAAWLGVPHAVGTNSGTASLELALRALGLGPGDEVITVPNTDIGTVSAIHATGATSVFVDVLPDTLTMDPQAAAAAIGPRTRALLPVDLYGHPAELPALLDLAGRHGLAVVEDACLALGAAIEGRKVGTFATITCFSFAPTKHLGAYGSAGMAVTADPDLARRMRRLIGYGQDREHHYGTYGTGSGALHLDEGMNERLDEIQAALLHAKLAGLEDSLIRRRENAALYDALLQGTGVETPAVREGATHAYRNYVVRHDARDALRVRLAEAGVATNLVYSPPLHLQPVYAAKGQGRGSFPVSERACARLLGLPVGPHLREEQVRHVAAVLAG